MDRRPVDRPVAVPNGQMIGNGERLAVTDDHAADAIVRHPGDDPGVDAHPRQADLVARPVGVLIRCGRKLLFVRSPAHFGRGDALFAQALDAPRVDELIDLLGLVGDLRVALAAMDHLHAELHRQAVEGAMRRPGWRISSASAPLTFRSASSRSAMSIKPLLGPVRNQARIGAVFDNRRRPRLAPAGRHAADVHVPPIERPLGRMLLLAPP